MQKTATLFVPLVLPIIVAGCSTGSDEAVDTTHRMAEPIKTKTITGTIWYRERIMLPPNAVINVYLEDVSRADAPSTVLSETTIDPGKKGPPYHFTLEYDPAKIDNTHRYALRARIEAESRLLFINTRNTPVFGEQAQTPAKIMVSRVGGGGKQGPATDTPTASLTGTYWKLVELDGRPASLGVGERELHMVLTADENNVRGFSGCNGFTGTYEVNDRQLKLRPLAVTQRACVDSMEQEQRFLQALDRTMRFAISDDNLVLYDAGQNLILKFSAVYQQK